MPARPARYTSGRNLVRRHETATQSAAPQSTGTLCAKLPSFPGISRNKDGRHHQIPRARATAASAPPNRLPSLRRNCIPSSFFSPQSRVVSHAGSLQSASASPRRSRIGGTSRDPVQKPALASKKNHPRACAPSLRVFTHQRNHRSILLSLLSCCFLIPPPSFLCPQQRNHLSTQFHYGPSMLVGSIISRKARHGRQKFPACFASRSGV